MRREVMIGAGVLVALFVVGGCARLDSAGSGPASAVSAGSRPQPPTEDECIDELKRMIVRDDLYPWTTLDRIAFHGGSKPEGVEITLNEIHRGSDGADINTHPRIDTFLRKADGQWYVDNFFDLPDFAPGLIPYDIWLQQVNRK